MKTIKNKFFTAIVILSVIFFNSCENSSLVGIRGEGSSVEQTLTVNDFSSVNLNISGNLHITYGTENSVRVVGQQNIIENMKTNVINGNWDIEFKNPVRRHDELDIYITTDNLNTVILNGSGNIYSTNKFVSDTDVTLTINGSGNFYCDFDAPEVKSTINGSGSMELSSATTSLASVITGSGNFEFEGNAENLDVVISGSGSVFAYDFPVDNAGITISASGSCEVSVAEKLDVEISGSGNVKYKGLPQVNVNISGSGNVINKN